MKKTRFFLMALLLVVVMAFTGCGSNDADNDAIPDNDDNRVEQDINDGADDIKDDADRIGDDIKDDVDRAGDDMKDNVKDNANDNVKNDVNNVQ